MSYFCVQCGEIFSECEIVCEDPSPIGVSLPEGFYHTAICPFCGSEELEEAQECPCCGAAHSPGDRSELCEECKDEIHRGVGNIIAKLSGKSEKSREEIQNIVLEEISDEWF